MQQKQKYYAMEKKYYATETKELLCNRKNMKWIGVQ